MIKRYQIITENIYNFNKKRFLIKFGWSLKRVMVREALKLKRIIKVKQDGS
jgi:hypothetical protein